MGGTIKQNKVFFFLNFLGSRIAQQLVWSVSRSVRKR
jgi:hypothetical protein